MKHSHAWGRNGAWGYQCLRCGCQSGKTFDDLPKGECR